MCSELMVSWSSARLHCAFEFAVERFAPRNDETLRLEHPATIRHTADTGSLVTTETCNTPQNCNGNSDATRRTGPRTAAGDGATESRCGGDTTGHGARRGNCTRIGEGDWQGWGTWELRARFGHDWRVPPACERGVGSGTGELLTRVATLRDLP
mmetsp:Transcript_113368/g.259976  ORF Transcript_113368/g.259976 Transcript_113368/m.259976 type:complete len:154 (+) Transcript_113368:1387-1848(+)